MNLEGPLFDEKTLIKVNMGFGKVLTVETLREILKINSWGHEKLECKCVGKILSQAISYFLYEVTC